jgi:iron complex outermembrane receptor protein
MIRTSLSILLISFFFHVIGYSQEASLSGRVSSSDDGLPLVGAHVKLMKSGQVAITDFNGNYRFYKVNAGPVGLEASYVGYASSSMNINIEADKKNTLDFSLEPQAYLADEAVVTATGTEIARKDVSPAISVVPRESLEESKESALLTVVNEEVPGVFVSSRGVTGYGVGDGSAGNIRIRGVGGYPNTGVLVLIDGSPQYMGLFGHPLPDAYVSSDAERVEVIRGPASLLYGSNAMAGAINIITRQQKQDGLGGQARLSYGSYNTRKIMGNAGFRHKGFNVFASINHDYTDGHRDNSGFKIINGYLKVETRIGKNFKLAVDGSIADYRTEDPGPATEIDSSYILQDHWIEIRRNMLSMSLENKFSHAEGAIKVFYNSGEHDIYDGFHSTDYNYGLSIYESFMPFKGNTLSAGFDYKNVGGLGENVKAMMGQGIIFTDTNLYELGGYLLARQEFMSKLILTAGLRLHYNSSFGQEWVPQFGLNYLVNSNNIVKVSASKGFRNPTINELYMFPPSNPDLLPEHMWSYEGTYLAGIPQWNLKLEATAYFQKGENMIQRIGQFPNVSYENTGNFEHYGLELAASWEAFRFLSFESNYSWLKMKDIIVGAPVHQWYTAARFHHKKFAFKISGMYIRDLYTRLTPESKEQYYLLDARASYQVFKFMNIWVSGDNLLDQAYEINYDYPMPGIMVFAGLDLKFNTSSGKK